MALPKRYIKNVSISFQCHIYNHHQNSSTQTITISQTLLPKNKSPTTCLSIKTPPQIQTPSPICNSSSQPVPLQPLPFPKAQTNIPSSALTILLSSLVTAAPAAGTTSIVERQTNNGHLQCYSPLPALISNDLATEICLSLEYQCMNGKMTFNTDCLFSCDCVL